MSFLRNVAQGIAFGPAHFFLRQFGGETGANISDVILGGQLIAVGLVTGHPELSAFGFGLLKSKFRGTDSLGLAASQGAILRNRLNPKAPVPLVYGAARLGVIIADIAVDGASTNNEDLYVPTVICHGSRDDLGIASIGKIFFNNQLAIDAAEALQTPYTSSNLAFAKYLGTSTQDVADLTIGGTDLDTLFSEWDKSTDDGRGLAGVLFKLTWDRDVYPTALPTFNMEVKGNLIEDTRSEVSGVDITFNAGPKTIVRDSGSYVTDGYVAGDRVAATGSASNNTSFTISNVAALTLTVDETVVGEGASGSVTLKRWAHPDNGGDNPAMVLRDYLLSSTYGAGIHITSSMIDDTSFEAMANYCDESVSNPAGSASRFTANGWLSTGNSVRQNIEIILASMRASLIPQGSTLHLFIPRVVSASNITLNADNILGDWDFSVPGADTKINMVRMTYIDPDKEFQADVVQWPEPGATNPYLTADGGLTQERSLDLPLTQNVYTAQQIGMTFLKESRHGIVVSLTANQTALQLEIGDVVKVTHDTPGWTDKLFWVAAMTILPDTNVSLTLVEYEISVTDDMTFADVGPDTITRASGSWIDDGFVDYDEVTISGSASNNKTVIVASVGALVLTLDAAETLTNEGPVSCTVKTSIYGLDSQSTAVADVADNLPRNPNDIADPTGLTLTATGAEAFFTATGSYVPRIKVTLTDADDAFVDGYDVEAKRTSETNFDRNGFMPFGATEYLVSPVTEGESWSVRVRSRNDATGVTGDWVSATVTPDYPSGSSTTAIEDGWSASQNAAAPEDGDVELEVAGSVAYCNLEDANLIVTTFTIYYDVDGSLIKAGETSTITLYKNDAAGSTSWTEVDSNSYDNGDNVTDQTLSFSGSMGADYDFRVVITYSYTPTGDSEQATYTMHGEDHGSQAGVQYDKITTAIVGGTLPAVDVTMAVDSSPTFNSAQQMQDIFHSAGWISGGVLSNDGSANINVTAGAGAIRATDGRTVQLLFFDWAASTTNAIADGAVKYVGVEWNAGSPQVVLKATNTWDFNTAFPLGSVVREGSILHISQAEHAVGDHANFMVQRVFEVQKFARDNITGGLILGEDGANRYVTVSAGTVWERLNKFAISAIDTDPGGGGDTFQTYKHVAGVFTLTTGVTTWPNTEYDNGTALVTMTNNRHANLWFYLEPDGDLVMLYGTAQYTSSTQAELETPPTTVPLRLTTHGFLIGRMIFKKSASATLEISSVFTTVFSPTLVSDHGNLAGLSDDDHAQYLLVAGSRAMSGALDMGTNNITNVGTYSGGAITATALITTSTTGPQFGDASGATAMNMIVQAAAGQERGFQFNSGTSRRWRFFADGTAESGSDAGSDFVLVAYDDSATLIDIPLTIVRAAGGIISWSTTRLMTMGALTTSEAIISDKHLKVNDTFDNSAFVNDPADASVDGRAIVRIHNEQGTAGAWTALQLGGSGADYFFIQSIRQANNDYDLRFLRQWSFEGTAVVLLEYEHTANAWSFQSLAVSMGALTATTVTATGLVLTPATASGGAGLRLPHGTAPTSPVDGDRWLTSVSGFDRIDGVTKQIHYVGGDLVALGVNSDDTPVAGAMHFKERSSDPGDPTEGNAVIWMSDGTGAGDDGDIMIKVQAGASVKTGTLFDHSVA